MKRNSIVTRVAFSTGFTLITFSLILFFVARSFLGVELMKRDRDIIRQEIQEYAGTLQEGGSPAVAVRYQEELRAGEHLSLYLRVLSPDGTAELEEAHDSYEKYDLERLYHGFGRSSDGWFQIQRLDGETGVLDVTEIRSESGLTLQLGMNSRFRDELLGRFTAIFFQFAGVALLLSCAAGIAIAGTTLRPLLRFRDSISKIETSGNLALNWEEVDYSESHEIQELSFAFNSLRQRIQRLINSMKDGIDMVAHETKSPLTRLRMKLEESFRLESEADRNENLADALEETDRITGIINTILQVAESNGEFVSNALTTFPARDVFRKVIDLYEDTAVQKGCLLQMQESTGHQMLTADFERIVQAVSNLVDNAVKFAASGGFVRLSASKIENFISLEVSDGGQGISDEEQPLIWERLYRGNDSKYVSGLGLGLPLVLAIVRSHGGKVELESSIGQGSTFRILLPEMC